MEDVNNGRMKKLKEVIEAYDRVATKEQKTCQRNNIA
jgi:hypothetical protein